MTIDAVIPAVVSCPERLASTAKLLRHLAAWPGLVAHVVPQQRTAPDWRAAFSAIARGLLAAGSKRLLYLEDDAELASSFVPEAQRLLAEWPADVGAVALFSPRPDDRAKLRADVCLYDAPRPFGYCQAMLLTRDVARLWSRMLLERIDHPPSVSPEACDSVLGEVCDAFEVRLLVALPSLVQHRRLPSAFGHTACPQSNTFEESHG